MHNFPLPLINSSIFPLSQCLFLCPSLPSLCSLCKTLRFVLTMKNFIPRTLCRRWALAQPSQGHLGRLNQWKRMHRLRYELYGLRFEAITGNGLKVEEPIAAEAAFFESSQKEAHHGDCAWGFGSHRSVREAHHFPHHHYLNTPKFHFAYQNQRKSQRFIHLAKPTFTFTVMLSTFGFRYYYYY